jgi:RimJ/RimL family protein N-acetyltransferase
MQVTPVTLEGQIVRLEPLAATHEEALWELAQEREIWHYMGMLVEQRADFAVWMDTALRAGERGEHVPFAIVERATGRAIGSTRYFAIMPADRNLEIGHTWIGQPYRRTAVNTECKYLLLRHAFEVLGCARVQIKTDALNTRSRAAISRLGAVEEGILRKHMWVQNRRFRDTAMFSIVDDEWPAIKQRLEGWLGITPA